MENTTALMDAPRTRRGSGSRVLAVFAGGADRLDGALEHAIAPAIAKIAPAHWSFLRWAGADGPHVRLALDKPKAEELAALVDDKLQLAAAAPSRAPLLPRPASQRAGGAGPGVRLLPASAEVVPTDALDELSSEVVLGALPALESGRERCAFALALMATISQAALGREAGPELWRDAARRQTNTTARGQRLLAGLAARARTDGGELVELARKLRRDGAPAAGLERLADGCRELSSTAHVRRHAHLTCNRLGVSPLEEALLALVLAGADGGSSASGRAVVELDQISKRRDEETVIGDVSLTVHEGEVFVIVGPPGCGKSSVLGIAAGLRVASGGTVRVLGADPRDARRELAEAPALGMPDAELAEERTARENIELYLRDDGGAVSVDRVLEDAGLREHAGTAVADLGPGERRRLAIACTVVHGTAVLLLDEPTAGLSAVDRDEIWRIIGRRRERGATTILATTSVQEALCTGDRAALMDDGSLRAVGPPAQIAEEFFPGSSLHFHVTEKPDRPLLEELPEVEDVEIDERADHWAVEIATRQPSELLALLRADPEFPEILNEQEA